MSAEPAAVNAMTEPSPLTVDRRVVRPAATELHQAWRMLELAAVSNLALQLSSDAISREMRHRRSELAALQDRQIQLLQSLLLVCGDPVIEHAPAALRAQLRLQLSVVEELAGQIEQERARQVPPAWVATPEPSRRVPARLRGPVPKLAVMTR